MSTYKNLIGKDVNFLTTNPDNDAAEGQIWYNSPAGAFKDLIISEAWSSGGPLSTEHRDTSAAGTQTAGLCFSGSPPPGGITATEEYNGSGWGTGGALNTARRGAARFSAATQTAALVFGGSGTPNPTVLNATEEYNGTSWTSVNNLPAVKYIMGGAGIQTAALSFGGYSGTAALATTEEYDGTNWTAGNAMSTARYSLASAGLQTAALAFGGTPPETAVTEEYDGTNWTAGGDMNTARRYAAGCGTQDSALVFGAGPTAVVKTEKYDGTSWSETADMGIAQKNHGGAGSQSAALSCGGESPSNTGLVTQEFTSSINVITAGAWSAGGTIPYSSPQKNGSGILTAAFAVGGETPPGAMVNTSVSYNGTSWTATNNINSARGDVMAAGTLTAGLIMGGYQNVPDPNFLFEETEEFNGTSWSEVNDMPTGAYTGSGTGTQTAAFVNNMYIGSPGERSNVTYEYDGTNWSNGGSTAQTTNSRSSVGTLTAGLTVGGRPAPSTFIDKTELYDGTSWTSGVDMISIFSAGGQSSKGTQSDCIIFGSPKTPANTDTYKTDGTTWFTQPSMASTNNNGTGTSTAALAFGNSDTSVEFNGETTALNIKTITTS